MKQEIAVIKMSFDPKSRGWYAHYEQPIRTEVSRVDLGGGYSRVIYEFDRPREWLQLNWNFMFPPQTREIVLEHTSWPRG